MTWGLSVGGEGRALQTYKIHSATFNQSTNLKSEKILNRIRAKHLTSTTHGTYGYVVAVKNPKIHVCGWNARYQLQTFLEVRVECEYKTLRRSMDIVLSKRRSPHISPLLTNNVSVGELWVGIKIMRRLGSLHGPGCKLAKNALVEKTECFLQAYPWNTKK